MGSISQFSKQIPCLDVFITQKHVEYFLEEIPQAKEGAVKRPEHNMNHRRASWRPV
jgi:hypothetical protein